ncbi:PREDICTED: probable LRR receptor [Prunus dulcis]|uniref:non-specific serine/threonine protein kinase n=1 Tax=Prunus dulcis TaxID=3755 RepID=A0A5E4G416_PRUDU|nr:PREDICTED: probable LRR receptor [Prunus dulcis]
MRGNDGILYEAEDSALGPATFSVTSTQKWAVSNAGFPDNLNQSFVETTLTQVSGADLTARLFGTSRVSPGSLRNYGLGLQNGPYTVTLQFAETGNLRRKDFDISKEAGGVNRAVARPLKVNVTENYLDIHLFWAGKGTCCIPEQGDYGPLISAVHAASDTPTTPGKRAGLG